MALRPQPLGARKQQMSSACGGAASGHVWGAVPAGSGGPRGVSRVFRGVLGRPGASSAAMAGTDLPIRRYRRALVEAVRERPFLIVTGETGSGKSTQLPKYLLEAGNGAPRSWGTSPARCRRRCRPLREPGRAVLLGVWGEEAA